jgi:flagellar hook-basal body complex protein FliE
MTHSLILKEVQMNILPIEGIGNGQSLTIQKTRETGGEGFGAKLKQALSDVNELQQNSDQAMTDVTLGKLGIHEGMLAITEADLSLRLLVQVRNKIMDAYKEISRM